MADEEPRSVVFLGQSFDIAERIGAMALMRFAKVAQRGVDSSDMAGLAAMYDLIEQCLDAGEWERFQEHADKMRATGEQLMAFVKEVMQEMTARPTSRPSDSSAGPPPTRQRSTDASSSRVIERLESKGRPDLALIVLDAQQARQTA